MTTLTTCERCLDGRHVRCADKAACACSCRTVRHGGRPTAGGVVRTPRPSRPTKPAVAVGPRRRPGRRRIWPDDATRRRESARRKRGTYERVAAELRSNPTGRRWTWWTRELFAEECDRLARVFAG